MSSEKHGLVKRFLAEKFKHAAIVAQFGYQDEDKAMQRAGTRAARASAEYLDACGDDGRLALVPLLEDPEWGVRVFAAGYLVKLMPEQAVAVLKDVSERCPTRERMRAAHMLWKYEHGELDL